MISLGFKFPPIPKFRVHASYIKIWLIHGLKGLICAYVNPFDMLLELINGLALKPLNFCLWPKLWDVGKWIFSLSLVGVRLVKAEGMNYKLNDMLMTKYMELCKI